MACGELVAKAMSSTVDVTEEQPSHGAPTRLPPRPHLVDRIQASGSNWFAARPWLNNALLPGATLFIGATIFVLLRLAVAAHGDIGAFVQAGTQFTDLAKAPHRLAVRPGSGFDGQFYYRLALQPWNLSWSAHGITFDFGFRRQRVGYSYLAWLGAGGQAAAVPYSLVAVNVMMLGLLGFFSGKWAQSLGRHAIWGLLPAGYFGMVWSLSRDLTEITAITLVVGGIVAWRSNRFLLAGLAFSLAALSRETAMIVVLALAVTRGVEMVRRHQRANPSDVSWALPIVTFVGWQLANFAAYGSFPFRSEGQNTSLPFSGALTAITSWISHPSLINLLEVIQLAALVTLVVLALLNIRQSRSSAFERLAFVFAILLLGVLSSSVWNHDPRQFRTMVDVFVLGSGVLLGTRSFRPLLLTAFTWCVVVAVAMLNVKYI